MNKHNHKHSCPIGAKKHIMNYLRTDERGDWFECGKCGIWVKSEDLHKYEHE